MGDHDTLKILFLGSGNSCRSQMAEAFAKELKGDLITVFSAGSSPEKIDPLAVKAMEEEGIDISMARSKHVDELKNIDFDHIISVCGHPGEVCPMYPGTTRTLHVGFESPALMAGNAENEEEALRFYRRIREQIRRFIITIPESLDEERYNLKCCN